MTCLRKSSRVFESEESATVSVEIGWDTSPDWVPGTRV